MPLGLSAPDEWPIVQSHGGWTLLSLSKGAGIWRSIQKAVARGSFDYAEFTNHPEGPIKQTWLDFGWVPIVHDVSGDHLFVDLSLARGEKRGQTIEFSRTKGANRVVANSVGELLVRTAEDMNAGIFYYDKKRNLYLERCNSARRYQSSCIDSASRATHLLADGYDIRTMRELLGHKTLDEHSK